jgi:molybdenum cofactor synthesis domain-containing protein
MRDRTAAAIVIGNEILSGKVADTNSTFLARELRALGVALRRILVIPDEVDTIAAAVRECQGTFDGVFPSGGVGPTHDDVTIAGVASGLGCAVVRHPVLEERIREFSGGVLNEARLKMAEVPAGAELIAAGDQRFPIVRIRNIYIMPGIPEIFQAKFLAMKARFAVDPFFMRVIYTSAQESAIAEHLNDTMAAFPELQLGSYPRLADPEYRVRVTLESKDPEYLEGAFAHLMSRLEADLVVRIE